MRIGIDARFFGGEQSKGLGRYTQKLVEHLLQLDTEHTFVLFVQQETADAWKHNYDHIELVIAPYRWYTVGEQIHMPRVIKKAKVDFMHFPHFNVPLLYRGDFIVTIHDLIILHYPTQRASTLGPLLYAVKQAAGKAVLRHAVKHSQKIITVSKFSKQDIVEYYGIQSDKVEVTYEAAEETGDASAHNAIQDAQSVLQKYGVQKPYVLYVGNAYPHKNLEILLDVAEEIKNKNAGTTPEWQFVFVGKSDYFYDRLKEEAEERGLQEYVHFTGFVSDEDLPILYKEALVYVFPSRCEGFGLPPLEAMQQGVPVIAADSSCLPEILGDAAQYFEPDDISGIINLVTTLKNDADLRATCIEKGMKQVQQYSWKRMAQQTLDVYEQNIKL